MSITNKLWKLKGYTQRVLNINADRVIPHHTIYIFTVDDEPVSAVRMEHEEALDPAVKSNVELQLAQHIVETHNDSLKSRNKAPHAQDLTPTKPRVIVASPKKKGGWPKGKPRKPKVATNGQETQGAAQSRGSATASTPQPNQGGAVQEGVQAQPFAPSGEGWFRG